VANREPDNHRAPLEESWRRQLAALRGRRDRNYAQSHENLGRAWVASLSGAAATRVDKSSINSRLKSLIAPLSVDTPGLPKSSAKSRRASCIADTEAVEPVGPLRIQPSIVNLGGAAVV
jgi:hypothetical protein